MITSIPRVGLSSRLMRRRLASNTILLVNFNGTNGSTTFVDQSAAPHTLTANGSAQITTTGPKFGTGALSLGGSSDAMIISGSPADFGFGASDDVCVEFWANPTSNNGPSLFDFRSGGAGGAMGPVMFMSGGTLFLQANGGAVTISGGSVATGSYQHFAWCRAAGSSRMFLDGNQVGSTTADTNNYITNSTLRFGGNGNNTAGMPGKIDGIRVKRGPGAGIYTANFIPSAAEFTS